MAISGNFSIVTTYQDHEFALETRTIISFAMFTVLSILFVMLLNCELSAIKSFSSLSD
jgi:hypothetical protein